MDQTREFSEEGVDDPALTRFHRYLDAASLVKGGRVEPCWLNDGCSFIYEDSVASNGPRRVDGCSGHIEPIDRECSGRSTAQPSEYRTFLRPTWLMGPMVVPELQSPDRSCLARIDDGNINLRTPGNDSSHSLTNDGTDEFGWDLESPRLPPAPDRLGGKHRPDPWSPNSRKLFAIKVDRRAVPSVPFLRNFGREETVASVKIQMAGGALDIGYPYLIDVHSTQAKRLPLGRYENLYFTLVGWRPGGSEVVFTRHSRDFKTVDLLAADHEGGSVRTILRETADTFVALQHDVIYRSDNHITLLDSGKGFIWRSSRSGWAQFYLYAWDGTLLRALTCADYPVIDIAAIDPTEEWAYFTAHHDTDRPYDTHLCRTPFVGGEVERLTPCDGQNETRISPSAKTFIVINSRPDREYHADFHAVDGTHLATISRADIEPLEALGHVMSEEFIALADDGETLLWGVIHKPADFDPNQSYPLIDHLYAGPQTTMVARDFGFADDDKARLGRALAQLGYIVISIDARGTPERSKVFQDVVYGAWGRHEIPDHAAVIRQLAERYPYIDLSRVGAIGHSWGGYFATRALAQAPNLFRVAVASAPAYDPYDNILYEPYLNLPALAEPAYEYARLYPWASQIVGRLMMVVGTADPKNHADVLEMSAHLMEAAVEHEVVVLPDAGHSFAGRNEEYFIRKVVRFFDESLQPRGSITPNGSSARKVGFRL